MDGNLAVPSFPPLKWFLQLSVLGEASPSPPAGRASHHEQLEGGLDSQWHYDDVSSQEPTKEVNAFLPPRWAYVVNFRFPVSVSLCFSLCLSHTHVRTHTDTHTRQVHRGTPTAVTNPKQ